MEYLATFYAESRNISDIYHETDSLRKKDFNRLIIETSKILEKSKNAYCSIETIGCFKGSSKRVELGYFIFDENNLIRNYIPNNLKEISELMNELSL